jgi:hypothetical protein
MSEGKTYCLVLALTGVLLASCGGNQASSSEQPPSSTAYSSSVSLSSAVSPLKKATEKLYVLTDSGVENEDVSVYFLAGYGDVPFLNLSASLSILQRSISDSTVTTSDKTVTIGRSENSATIAFDFANSTVHYSDLDLYASNHQKNSVLDLISSQGTTADGKPKYLQSQSIEYYRQGNPLSFDLTKWGIPLHFEDGAGYLPVQTFADLVLSERNIFLITNGVDLFMSGAWYDDSSDMSKQFYSVTPSNKRSQEMADFSYKELALALDFQYGLKQEHSITDFSSYFSQVSGLKDRLTSTDALVADQGIYQLCTGALGDYHSSLQGTSAYAGKDVLATAKDASLRSPNYEEYLLIRSAFSAARTAVISALSGGAKSAFDSYEEYTNADGKTTTAFVTFDSFTKPTTDYYPSNSRATKDAKDTYGILEYAHTQILRTDSPVTNVVLDLSCNGGGSIDAGIYTAGWFLPYGILNAKNTLSGAQESCTYASDINLDGVYDETDRLITHRNLHLYCLISPASFSCSNFVASIFKDSDQVRLLGRHTSGGACIVQHLSLADGTLFATSGNRRLASGHNGTFSSIEGGVEADFSLDTYLDFYNRAALAQKLATL